MGVVSVRHVYLHVCVFICMPVSVGRLVVPVYMYLCLCVCGSLPCGLCVCRVVCVYIFSEGYLLISAPERFDCLRQESVCWDNSLPVSPLLSQLEGWALLSRLG